MKDTRLTIVFSDAVNTQFIFKSKDKLILYEQLPYDPASGVAEVKEVFRLQTYEVNAL